MKNRNLVFMSSAILAIVLISILFFSQESYSLSKQIIDKCELDIDCGINGLIEISETNDEKTVLKVFGELWLYYAENVTKCHDHTHHLGKFLYDYYGDFDKAISIADATCGGALYHGIVENYLVEFENIDLIDLTSICTKFPRQFDNENLECVHGIGHGLYKIFDKDIFVASEKCKDSFTAIWEFERCSGGVFMENMMMQRELGFPDFNENDPHYPCNSVSQEFLRACYAHQSFYIILQQPNTSATKSFESCDEIPKENRKYCYRGVGNHITGNNLDDINRIVELCKLGDEEFHSECIKSAAYVSVDLRGIQRGFDVCKISPDYTKEKCYDTMGKLIKTIHGSENDIEEQCSKAENSKYSDICLNATLDTYF